MALSSSRRRRAAWVDSTAYFALVSERDENHGAALRILRRLQAEHWRLYTTPFVLAEVHALIVNRLRRIEVGLSFLHSIDESPSTTTVQPTIADQRRALAVLEHFRDKDFSFTDAISFVVMERLGISHAVAFEAHFTQFGWMILTPE